jgi:integrase
MRAKPVTRRITLPDGTKRRIYKYGEGADQRLEAEIRALTRSTDEGGPNETFHEFAKRAWYPSLEFTSPLTQRRYISAYRTHIRPRIGDALIGHIRKPLVQEFVFGCLRDGVSAPSIRFCVERISSVCNLAIDHEILSVNPCVRLKNLPKKSPKRHRAMDLMTAQELLSNTLGTPIGAPVFLALLIGLRRGEISGLRWSDLDRNVMTLSIQRQRQAQKGMGVVEADPKSGSKRIIPIPKAVIEEIDRRGDLDSEWICTRKGQPWTPQKLWKDWILVRGDYGLDEWTFHDLRHGAAGLLHQTGTGDVAISQILGHSKVDQTMDYTSATKGAVLAGLERLVQEVGNR